MAVIKKLAKSQVEITGELPAPEFDSFWHKAVVNLSQSVKIDGFRSGHIPESVLIKNIGEEAILDAAAELALQSNYYKIILDNKINAIGRPMITITKIAKGNPLGFKIVTAVIPEVKLPDYSQIAKKISKVKKDEASRLLMIERINEETEMELPDILVENELNKVILQMKASVEEKGLKFEEYLKDIKKSLEDIRKESRNKAEKNVRYNLILKNIARKERLVVPPEEVLREAEKLVKMYKGADLESAKVYVEEILTNNKVFQFLEGNLEINN